jgi:hypothetical protein
LHAVPALSSGRASFAPASGDVALSSASHDAPTDRARVAVSA